MKHLQICAWSLLLLLFSGHALAQREGEKPKEPVYLDEERRLEVIEDKEGWQLIRLHDEVEASSFEDLYVITPLGVDSLPISQAAKDELLEDFGVTGGPGNVFDDGIPNEIIVMHKQLFEAIETGQIPPEYQGFVDLSEGCFGWSDKEKTKSWSFDEWSDEHDFTITDNVSGSYSVQVPINGEANIILKYRIKKTLCLPYKFKFKEVRAYGNVQILGDSALILEATLTGEWDWEWEIMNPHLGRISFSVGPIPVWIDFFLPTHAGLGIDVSLTGQVSVGADFGASGTFDYTCTSQTCTGTNDFQDTFDVDGVTGSLELNAKASAWARMMVRAEVYDDSILYAQAGAKGFVEANVWGYYGNACGDADGDGHNETVRALAADLDAGFDVVYGIGGLLLPDRDWDSPVARFFLGWEDLLGTGGSDALAPMMVGPSSITAGGGASYTVKMRPCYPYTERVDFTVGPGGWNGNTFIPEPKGSDPTQNQSVMSRGFNNPGTYDLVVTATADAKGRDLGAAFNRPLEVVPAITPPVIVNHPASQTVAPGASASFTVAAAGGSMSYAWYKDGLALSDGVQHSGSATSTLTVSNVDGTVAGAYHAVATNPMGSASSQPAQLAIDADQGAEIRVLRNVDRVELPSGSTYDFGFQPATVAMSRAFLICNDGNQALQIANVGSMVSGSGFSQIVTPAAPIAPLDCQVVRVRFHTATPGTFQGQLTIDNNDPDGGEDPYVIHLTGTATPSAPEINVVRMWDRLEVPSGTHYTMQPTPVGVPHSVAFDICNEGDGMLTLDEEDAMVSGAHFTQIETPDDPFISPGECDHVRVRFMSAVAGTFFGTVTISSNDADEDPYVIELEATATP